MPARPCLVRSLRLLDCKRKTVLSIRRERQLDGIAKAKERGVRFGVQPKLTEKVVKQIRNLRRAETAPEQLAPH